MKIKTLVVNVLWFGIIPKLSMLLSIIILPVVTPFLSVNDYGIIGIINAYVGIFTGLSTLGLHMHLNNTYYELPDHYRLAWRRLLYWIILGSIIGAFIVAFVLFIELPKEMFYNRYIVVLLAIFPILLNSNQVVAAHYYTLKSNPRPLVLRNLLGSICGVFVFFIAARYLKLGFLSWLLNSFVSSVIVFLLFVDSLWIKEKIYPVVDRNKKRIKEWLKIALPIIPHTVGHMIMSSSDRIIMSLLGVSVFSIGIYSNGYTMGNYVIIIIDAIFVAIMPLLQTTYRSNNHLQMRKIFLITQVFTILFLLFVAIWMKEIYLLLIRNSELQPSYKVATFITFANIVAPLYNIMSLSSFIKKKTKSILWLIFFPSILNVILNFIFIPIYGYMAAIFTTLVSRWIIVLVAIFHPFFKSEIKYIFNNVHDLLWLVFVYILTLVLSLYIGDFSLHFKIIVTFFFILGIGFLMFVCRKKICNLNFID